MITLQNAVSMVSGTRQRNFLYLRSLIANEFPNTLNALRLIDREYTAVKAPKGYNLVKRENKKLGFVYYVRYRHEGKALPSKWCTRTNNYAEACQFAEQNREKIIARYLERNSREAEKFFEKFYESGNPAFQSECRRNMEISEEKRKKYKSVVQKKFIPFLVEKRIRTFDEITVPLLNDFQDYLLTRGLKPQTVNEQMIAIKKVTAYLFRKGMIRDNPCPRLSPVPEKPEHKKTHGCYELEKLKGVFDRKWKSERAYVLNLLIYSTGMRNCEIKSFCKNDIVDIGGCYFIDLKKSKTKNGIRLVPLHERVYGRVMRYAKDTAVDTKVFNIRHCHFESKAAVEMGEIMGADENYLKENNITFYSGRHAWKTMMNAGGLGEAVEEFFMGHKVTGDVAKLYNHKDKQGKERMVKKAREIFGILDTLLFDTQP